ncbi:MAG: peptidylprolyl isomerase [Planctomycetaceae bacterium]
MKPILSLSIALALASNVCLAADTQPVIVDLSTTAGVIRLELDAQKAPKSVANFVNYVNSGHYAGTVFHRVIRDFMIQGGGMTPDLKEKRTEPPVVNEAGNGLLNRKYTVAMARTSAPHSATSQFFINTADNTFLNRSESPDGIGYAVFGKVVEGQDVVDKIAATKTTNMADPITGQPMSDVPVQPIVINSAKIVSGE